MSGPPDQEAEARRWLSEAYDELAWARVRNEHQELAAGIACFLSHLAAEKALKAALIAAGRTFPKTHNLLELRADVPEPLRSRIEPPALAELNPWAIAGRYAADLPEGTGEVADRLVELASTILDAVRDMLPGEGPDDGCHQP